MATETRKRYLVLMIRGSVVKRAELQIWAADLEAAEKLAEHLLDMLDPTAQLDSIHEMA